ncbi:MAG: hypothetical protein M3O71_23985 [Bacteroidota bacterium]|nr:hypothetical protein [Bacteroidota bacterium]
MTKSRKYFLAFVAFALSIMLVNGVEYVFCDNLTPFKLTFPLIFILPAYTILLFRVSKEKSTDK